MKMRGYLMAILMVFVFAAMCSAIQWILGAYPKPTPFAVFLMVSIVGGGAVSIGGAIHWIVNR